MKHNRIVIGLAVALVAALALVGVARIAPAQAQAVKQAVVQVVTTVTDTVLPAPSPSPIPAPPQVGSASTPAPPVNPPAPPVTTPEPTSFPHLIPSPTAAPAGPQQTNPPGAPASPPGEAPAPQTEVFVSASPCTGVNFDVNTGGCKGPAPFTVTFSAQLQLGVAGVVPTYQWSNGMTGQSITVEYKTPGVYTAPDVTVTQVVNGVPYQITSATHTRITITVS